VLASTAKKLANSRMIGLSAFARRQSVAIQRLFEALLHLQRKLPLLPVLAGMRFDREHVVTGPEPAERQG
jgi:hypothetical protein